MKRSVSQLISGLLLCALPALAQPTAPPDTLAETLLPAVEVNAAAEEAEGPVTGYTAHRSATATATRTDLPLNEIPQSISVITADLIRDQNAQTLQEVLRYTAGVHAEVYGLDNRGDWFALRGGSEGSTLLDHLRLPLTGWYGVVRNEPYAFERVEVLRGPSSVMAGQNGPGGVVNMVSKQPLETAQREVALQLGNYGHQQLAADLGGPLNEAGSLRYRLVLLGRDSGTQVQYADMERQYVAPSLTWQASGATTLTAYAQFQRDRSRNTEGFFPLAGTLYPGPQGLIPIDRFVGEPDWDTYGGYRVRMGYELDQALSENWTLRHHLRRDQVKGSLRSMYANFWEDYLEDGRSLNRTWYATNDTSRITNADLMLEGKLRWGRLQHTLLVGLDAMRSESSKLYWAGAATPLDVYAPTYGTFALPALTAATAIAGSSGESSVEQWGLLVQDQLKFDERWVVMGALRRDQAKNTEIGGSATDDQALTKNLGLVYLARGGFSPYLGYSESFEPQAGADRSGKAFDPRRGGQFEAGLKWAPAKRKVAASAALYRLEETGRLTSDPVDPSFSVQRGKVRVKGLELEASAGLRAWDLVASYAFTTTRDQAAETRLPNVPDHSASLWAVHQLDTYGLPGLKAGLGVRRVGKTWDGNDDRSTPAAALVDALVSWDWGNWSWAVNASNLTDKTYLAACLDRGDCWYGTKREAATSLAYRW